jgi:hypothetical protein
VLQFFYTFDPLCSEDFAVFQVHSTLAMQTSFVSALRQYSGKHLEPSFQVPERLCTVCLTSVANRCWRAASFNVISAPTVVQYRVSKIAYNEHNFCRSLFDLKR